MRFLEKSGNLPGITIFINKRISKLNMPAKKTLEEEKQKIDAGEKEQEVYSEAGLEDLEEHEDEITEVDEGFMKGYNEGAKSAKCVACGKVLGKEVIELEHNDQIYRFCCSKCAEKFEKKWEE